MRCANLTETWAELSHWFDQRDVLVLPPLAAHLPLTRLDADAIGADAAEVAIGRLRQLIDHFGVRVVYVERITAHRESGDTVPELGVLVVRVLVAGAVHELRLFADWYVELLDSAVGAEASRLR
jgi:hypothetical protein